MTEREIRQAKAQWDAAFERLSGVQLAIEHLRRLEASLLAECKRLAEIIDEHDDTPIMTTDEGDSQAAKSIKIGKAVRRERR